MSDIGTPNTPSLPHHSYVEWAPIAAGAVLALSLSFVLLTFGAALGMAVLAPWSANPVVTRVIWGGAFWFLLVQLWSFSLGGYVAGRMRHRWAGASETEITFRDGAHGLIVWGLTIVLGVTLGSIALSSGIRGTADANGTVNSETIHSGSISPMPLALDRLFRSTQLTPAVTSMSNFRPEAARLLMGSIGDDRVASTDRAYLSQIVAARTGLSALDAETRVTSVGAELRQSLEKTRRASILLGFLAAAALLVAAATAWWAACVGGTHRDQGTIWEGFSTNQTLWTRQEIAIASRRNP